MKLAGWFEDINGVVLGRSSGKDNTKEQFLNYEEVITSFFSEAKIPMIYDVDIGHRQPNLTILNGTLVEIGIDKDNEGFLNTCFQEII